VDEQNLWSAREQRGEEGDTIGDVEDAVEAVSVAQDVERGAWVDAEAPTHAPDGDALDRLVPLGDLGASGIGAHNRHLVPLGGPAAGLLI